MSDIFARSLREVIAEAASAAPTPGGGSVSAITGAFGAAMVAMVANLTVGKEKYRDVEAQVREQLQRLEGITARLEGLVRADMEAFAAFMAVYKLPADTDEEKAARARARQAAAIQATEAPLAIGDACIEALEAAVVLAAIGNNRAISDVGVGAYLAEASLKSALLSVDINLPAIDDAAYVDKAKGRRDRLLAEAERLRAQAVHIVSKRIHG
ncbi:methenyltetrahydrofolate cyclohydrolase, putative [Heliomicrobium modesticaldum Ice1]|uniref:Methenyltetrahydrofolate cyclohydrolase, putative n=1 Tax=Heliobacterium modesticaldum (strain ATCC 51547 / Ice1) TaxID=498761 RepID=B0TFD0_HELMI|nr:cyclodeaminase/cyclohydrolase family protein [Heliomicrobium modesticaldum]ABZ84447.1 methenyltetrahydrofolate cyclohydrolase, putative [Heliomicrobium modesticaldum Ice1]